eukprot:3753947-Amphidinium_carterae.1
MWRSFGWNRTRGVLGKGGFARVKATSSFLYKRGVTFQANDDSKSRKQQMGMNNKTDNATNCSSLSKCESFER